MFIGAIIGPWYFNRLIFELLKFNKSLQSLEYGGFAGMNQFIYHEVSETITDYPTRNETSSLGAPEVAPEVSDTIFNYFYCSNPLPLYKQPTVDFGEEGLIINRVLYGINAKKCPMIID